MTICNAIIYVMQFYLFIQADKREKNVMDAAVKGNR